jgi:hypothetical protein
MRALLDIGANPNSVALDGTSPVFKVFSSDGVADAVRREMFGLLRDAGADISRVLPDRVSSLGSQPCLPRPCPAALPCPCRIRRARPSPCPPPP